MKTTAVTSYGKVGTDFVRMTFVILDDGSKAVRRADGSGTILPSLPTEYRTSSDIVATVAAGLARHAWKTTFDLDGIVRHFIKDEAAAAALVLGLVETYMKEAEIAA